ncbi:MAG: TMEM175 family protein, partial [Chloroflexota bacterium]
IVRHAILRGMTRGRLEAFSDAVIAIAITIMVLGLVPPRRARLDDLLALWPHLLSYVLSFAYLAIYWNNHHHLLQAARTVSGGVLWANMHLLFWLSLIPFGTAWIGETQFATVPMAIYGVLLIMSAIAYWFLVRALIRAPGQSPTIAEALAGDRKGALSPFVYGAAIVLASVAPLVSLLLYMVVAAIWIVPDPRIERRIAG